MKYLLITLEIQCGEYSFIERCLLATKLDDLKLAAFECAKQYYEYTEYDEKNDIFEVNSWDLSLKLLSYKEVSEETYYTLERLFDTDADGDNDL